MKPDYEAEEILSASRRSKFEVTNKSDLLKPVVEKKKNTDNAQNKTDDDNMKHADHKETKGFDTLMAEDID